MAILELKDVNIMYEKKIILENVNLAVQKNEIVCIMGPSGYGKSTLLSLITGFLEENGGNYTGEVLFKGENIRNIKITETRKNISTLFQDSQPFPLSIEKNILYPIEFYEGRVKDKSERVKKYLEYVNLYDEVKDNLKRPASRLSGGQKQRLCIARMLTTNPEVLIFDEPCSSLDKNNMLIIESLLKKLAEKYTIIMTTHKSEQAERIADKLITITEERKVVMQ